MSFKDYIKEHLPWIRSIYRKRLSPINLIHNIFDKPVVVLLYHRVNYLNRDLFNINVTPDNFERHIQVLKNHYNVITYSLLFGFLMTLLLLQRVRPLVMQKTQN